MRRQCPHFGVYKHSLNIPPSQTPGLFDQKKVMDQIQAANKGS
jgi:hypothetical protein